MLFLELTIKMFLKFGNFQYKIKQFTMHYTIIIDVK